MRSLKNILLIFTIICFGFILISCTTTATLGSVEKMHDNLSKKKSEEVTDEYLENFLLNVHYNEELSQYISYAFSASQTKDKKTYKTHEKYVVKAFSKQYDDQYEYIVNYEFDTKFYTNFDDKLAMQHYKGKAYSSSDYGSGTHYTYVKTDNEIPWKSGDKLKNMIQSTESFSNYIMNPLDDIFIFNQFTNKWTLHNDGDTFLLKKEKIQDSSENNYSLSILFNASYEVQSIVYKSEGKNYLYSEQYDSYSINIIRIFNQNKPQSVDVSGYKDYYELLKEYYNK